MLTIMAVGVGLVLFGALILIRYHDRPGGTVKWMGMEMRSSGAGLPLVGLGVLAVAFGAYYGPEGVVGTLDAPFAAEDPYAGGPATAFADPAPAPAGAAAEADAPAALGDVRVFVADLLGLAPASIDPELSLRDQVSPFERVDLDDIVAGLEERYSVEIAPHEVDPWDRVTVVQLARLVSR